VDGVGEDASHAHAPLYPYLLGIHGTVWGFGLSLPPLGIEPGSPASQAGTLPKELSRQLILWVVGGTHLTAREGSNLPTPPKPAPTSWNLHHNTTQQYGPHTTALNSIKWHSLRSCHLKAQECPGPLPSTHPCNPFPPMKSIIHGHIRIIGQ
jgi:hypothetical protein